VSESTDFVIDSDNNTFPGVVGDSKFKIASSTITGTAWQAKVRAGNGFHAEASVFDPNSTWTG